MSTQSAFCFEWSVKCIGIRFCVGIASQLKREIEDVIINYDQNAIMVSVGYYIGSPRITRGNNTIHSNLTKHKTGDIIRFRFDPHAKKLLIDSVRILKGRIYINLLIILEWPFWNRFAGQCQLLSCCSVLGWCFWSSFDHMKNTKRPIYISNKLVNTITRIMRVFQNFINVRLPQRIIRMHSLIYYSFWLKICPGSQYVRVLLGNMSNETWLTGNQRRKSHASWNIMNIILVRFIPHLITPIFPTCLIFADVWVKWEDSKIPNHKFMLSHAQSQGQYGK